MYFCETLVLKLRSLKLKTILIILSVILTACNSSNEKMTVTSHKANGSITNFEAKGNLMSTKALGCVPIESLSSEYTPADIYHGVAACIKQKKFITGVELYGLAGVYGRFDQLRMIDRSSRQAMKALRVKHFSTLSKEDYLTFRKTLKSTLNISNPQFHDYCDRINKLGKPTYTPTYMIKHGMSAFTGSPSGVKPSFDSNAGWQESLDKYLHCA